MVDITLNGGPAPPVSGTVSIGKAIPQGVGLRPRLSLEAAATFAIQIDTARVRAATEGRNFVYTIRWH
ncbi:MAG: hypothetical protein ACYCPN_05155 [Thermoplasmata archaeon]